MRVAPEESRAPKAQGLWRPSADAGVLVLLRQVHLPLSLLGPRDLLYEVLVCGGRVAETRGEGPPQADRHWLEEALGGSPVEARDVDVDAGLMMTHGRVCPRVVPGHLPHD